jgi:hypothetical protein
MIIKNIDFTLLKIDKREGLARILEKITFSTMRA